MAVTPNKNYLSPTGFRVTINSTDFANLEYFCIRTSLPAITQGEVSIPFQKYNTFTGGEKIEWSPFNMTFQIDEYMENYLELYNWLVSNQDINKAKTSDMILTILDNKNNKSIRWRYVDAFPTSIGQLEFITQNTDVQYVTVDATFRYSYFEPLDTPVPTA